MTAPDPTTDDVTALGSLLAGEVDGSVDELAAYILASSWLAQRDARVRGEALREAADDLEGRLGTEGAPKSLWEFREWLRARVRVERGESL